MNILKKFIILIVVMTALIGCVKYPKMPKYWFTYEQAGKRRYEKQDYLRAEVNFREAVKLRGAKCPVGKSFGQGFLLYSKQHKIYAARYWEMLYCREAIKDFKMSLKGYDCKETRDWLKKAQVKYDKLLENLP